MSGPQQFIRLSASEQGPIISNIHLPADYPWPPPGVVYTVTPHGMGWEHAVVAPDADMADELAGFMEEAENKGMDLRYTMTPWRRVSCSELDAEMVTDTHVARGAEYVPIGEEEES